MTILRRLTGKGLANFRIALSRLLPAKASGNPASHSLPPPPPLPSSSTSTAAQAADRPQHDVHPEVRDNATDGKNKNGNPRKGRGSGGLPDEKQKTQPADVPDTLPHRRGINLNLNSQSLEIIQQTLAEAVKHGLLHPSHGRQAHVDSVPKELARFQRWRLHPADAEARSIELQE